MKSFAGAALVAAATASELKLAWTDCGDSSTHTKITSFTPASITTGQKSTMTGTGNLDEDVTAATFDLEMTTMAGKISCKGDASTSKTCGLPLGTGSLTFDAMTFPLKKGSTSVSVDLSLSSMLPPSLASTTTKVTAAAANGDKLFCMQIKSSKALEDKPEVNYEMKWKNFKEENGKSYSSAIEEEQRFQIFKVNVDFIYSMNIKGNSFELGVTPFADLTADEFGASHFGIAKPDAM